MYDPIDDYGRWARREFQRMRAEHLTTVGEYLGVPRLPSEPPRRHRHRIAALTRLTPGTTESMLTAVSLLPGVRSVMIDDSDPRPYSITLRVEGGVYKEARGLVDEMAPLGLQCVIEHRKAPLWWRVLNWASRAWWRAWYRVRG